MPIRVEQTEESRMGWSGSGNYKWNYNNGTPKHDPATPLCVSRLEPGSRKLANISGAAAVLSGGGAAVLLAWG